MQVLWQSPDHGRISRPPAGGAQRDHPRLQAEVWRDGFCQPHLPQVNTLNICRYRLLQCGVNMDPGSEKIRYGSRFRSNFDTDPDPGKNDTDPDPGKTGFSSRKIFKNAHIPCFVCAYYRYRYLTITFL